MNFHRGFQDIKVKLIGFEEDLAKKCYEFGRFSHDFNEKLPEHYDEHDESCVKLIDKIIAGTTLPKFSLEGHRITFSVEGVSRICLAQITRDNAIFGSAGGGVFPLTQDFNIPLSIIDEPDIMELVTEAQSLLEKAYIKCAEKEIPALEARYIGLHCQTINLTCSYTPSSFVRSCYSRTSSNFCDECNLVYRLMFKELIGKISTLQDVNSLKLWNWLITEQKCINDGFYNRERLYNSDFTYSHYNPDKSSINDWRRSGWKKELERMSEDRTGYLTLSEKMRIDSWKGKSVDELPTTYDTNAPDVLKNAIKQMPYYKGE